MAQHIGEHELARLMLGGKILHRRRLRQALLAHILRERSEGEGGDEALEDESESGTDEHRLARLLIGSSIVRRRRLRALMLAHLLREKHEAAEEEEEGGEEVEDGAEHDGDRQLARLLIGSGVARRERLRRAIVAHALREAD